MAQAKRASKGKRPSKAVSLLRNRRDVFGRVDRRIASGCTAGVFRGAECRIGSRYTLAEYGVPDPHSSMRRKSPTSAWRRSISSTKTTSETPSRAYKSLFEAAAADTAAEAAGAEAVAAAFEAAAAAFEAAALAFEAAEAAALAFEAAAGEAAVAAGVGGGWGWGWGGGCCLSWGGCALC